MLSLLRPISTWPSRGRIPLCFGGDVGGSGIRIRLTSSLNPSYFLDLPHIKVRTTSSLIRTISELGQTIHSLHPTSEFRGAALALAGPVNSDQSATLTNWPGTLADRTIRLSDLSSSVFPANRSTFLNDLEAGTHGIFSAHNQGILPTYFEQLWPFAGPRGPIISPARTAVFAMGSGLGVGLLVRTPALVSPIVLPTELGHLGVPMIGRENENWEYERDLFDYAAKHWSGGRHAPEFEDLASGRGLCLCYRFVVERSGGKVEEKELLEGGKIAEKARMGERLAKEAVALQYVYLVRAAKLVAVTLSCDSVLFALDNAVFDNVILHENEGRLCKEFYEFVRPDWMKSIRVYSQTKLLNFNILGTEYIARILAGRE